VDSANENEVTSDNNDDADCCLGRRRGRRGLVVESWSSGNMMMSSVSASLRGAGSEMVCSLGLFLHAVDDVLGV
jgi:hypothetical protein